jgi:hypothetical protein
MELVNLVGGFIIFVCIGKTVGVDIIYATAWNSRDFIFATASLWLLGCIHSENYNPVIGQVTIMPPPHPPTQICFLIKFFYYKHTIYCLHRYPFLLLQL